MTNRLLLAAVFITTFFVSACDTWNSQTTEKSVATEANVIDSSKNANLNPSTDGLMSRAGGAIDIANHPGKQLFEKNCLICHDGRVKRAPAAVWLEMMSPDALINVMKDGIMSAQSSHLSSNEQLQVAEYITRTSLQDYLPPEPPAQCEGAAMQFVGDPPGKVNWGHDTNRFIPADIAGISASDVPNLKLKWAFAYPAALRARSQPSIGWSTIFVGSHDGTVYAFDLDSGCVKWSYRAPAEVRTAIVVDPDTERLYFGDVHGRVYGMNAKTGDLIWQVKVDDHANATVTGTPSLGGGQLFVPISSLEVMSAADPTYACCTFIGAVAALDLENGEINWKTRTVVQEPKEFSKTSIGTQILGPSGAPVWNSPAFDAKRNRIYFGSGENYSSPADENSDTIFAVDAATGERIWQRQFTQNDAWNVGCVMGNENCPEENGPDYDFAASPIIVSAKGKADILVVGQKSGDAFGLNIETGEILWNQRLGRGGTSGGVHFGMAADHKTVFVPINDMDGTGGGDISLYGAGLHAVDAATGNIKWRNIADNVCGERESCDPGISSAVTAIPGVVFAGHLDGRFRAYAAESGEVIWTYDTTQLVDTVTGVTASGGSMSGPGPAVSDGHVVLNSGYGLYGHMPGNLLLVFEAKAEK
ncbi:MAG: polyvinyl alcohol dehydrogenase (cytochrome) [Candidatus Azotimanducaceae bacterium]|jgi:polyvinyl alcohol dehydrogenase (cytochrome)